MTAPNRPSVRNDDQPRDLMQALRDSIDAAKARGTQDRPAASQGEAEEAKASARTDGVHAGDDESLTAKDALLIGAPAPSVHHKIEEAVRVYLVLSEDGTRWEIDGPTLDGYELNSDYDSPLREDCDCGDQDACESARIAACSVPLPTGDELIQMLLEAQS